VKSISKIGFCSVLKRKFHLTQPTSLELEEILHNPTSHPMIVSGGSPTDARLIELLKGDKRAYSNTSFGKIEKSFIGKQIESV
jgi:hypothetical protein